MPQGADAVVMVEETERIAGRTTCAIFTPVYPRQHVGRRGADIAAGQTVLAPGDVLNPSRIGALAAIGALRRRRLREAARRDPLDRQRDRRAGPAARARADLRHQPLHALGDHRRARRRRRSSCRRRPTRSTISSAAIDIGARRGRPRLFRRQLGRRARPDPRRAAAGAARCIFHGIAVKPGKPTVFGTIGGKPVLGMPGYPTSCLSNGYMLLVPMLRRMARLPEHRPQTVRVPLARRIVSTTGRHQFYTVRHRRRRGRAGVQGVRRHHEHGARGRLHRDPRADRHRRSRRDRGSEAVLMAPTRSHAR